METQSANPPKKNMKKAVVAGSLAAAIAAAGTIAYFTDRVDTSAQATAGTVDIALDANWSDVANFNPGDKVDIGYTIQNDGNKSVDIRERIVVKSSVAMDTADQAEFEVYKAADVEQDAYGAYIPKDGAEPVTTGAERSVSDDQTQITYEIAEYVLNGTGENAETEDGISVSENESDYVLVFKAGAANAFQGANASVDLVAEAKQHRNTGEDTWAEISTESVTIGGAAVDVVPER